LRTDCGYEVLNLYTMVRASRRDYLAPDGIHFNAKGHRVVANLVKRGFSPNP
jgi:lysophospholipase L1-like esterase